MANITFPSAAAKPAVPPWNDPVIRGWAFQIVVIGLFVALVTFLVQNTLANLERQKIATGFSFLVKEAGFDIGDTVIPYSAADSYGRALLVGMLNTLRVAVIGIVLSTILGTLVGIGRLSSNWLLAKICAVYVEIFRNVPLLLWLLLIAKFIRESLPGPKQAIDIAGSIFISNRGVSIPVPVADPIHKWMGVALLVGIAAAFAVHRWARARQEATGQQFPTLSAGAAIIVGLPVLAWLAGGAPTALSVPELKGFNFSGGSVMQPEFVALLLGLTLYTSAFIAEIVRSGILAIHRGQTEAAYAIGLSRAHTTRLVLLPQALRVIVPPMTSSYLNITKNSSLAIAIGHPDLVAAINVTINQTGQAIEGVLIIMVAYLSVSLSISLFMNWYNKRIALVER
ncbi:MAG: amino acid ABC transporter permease [Rhodospirillales bacterium]|nr:amino acid ABC transporter permease [Rhodospirillales bacterium]